VSGSTALPYTTTGAGLPEGGAFVTVGDAALRQELASPGGGDLVTVTTSTGEQTLVEALDGRVVYFDSLSSFESAPVESFSENQIVNVLGTLFRINGSSKIPLSPISALTYGAIPDFETDNSQSVYNALVSAGEFSVDLLIPRGVRWDYNSVPEGQLEPISKLHPDNISIYDYSGWDYDFNSITGQFKVLQKTNDPQSKNAHEYILSANWHPGIVVDVRSDASNEDLQESGQQSKGRASTVYRKDGRTEWLTGIDPGSNGTQPNSFRIVRNPASGLSTFMIVAQDDARIAFNSGSLAPSGVAWTHKSLLPGNALYHWISSGSNDISFQYRNEGDGLLWRDDFNAEGLRRVTKSGSNAGITRDNFTVSGQKNNSQTKTTTYSISNGPGKSESGDWFNNAGAPAGFGITLPDAEPGQSYKFFVVTANNITVFTQSSDQFRGLSTGTAKRSNSVGSILEVYCAVSGYWEFVQHGTWSDI
jgi:hypothetical protein